MVGSTPFISTRVTLPCTSTPTPVRAQAPSVPRRKHIWYHPRSSSTTGPSAPPSAIAPLVFPPGISSFVNLQRRVRLVRGEGRGVSD